MKKLLVLVLAVTVAVSFSGVSFAQAPAVKEAPTQGNIKQQVEQGPGAAMPATPGTAAPPAKGSAVKEAPASSNIKQQVEQAPGSAAPKPAKKSTKAAKKSKTPKVKESATPGNIKQQEEQAQPPVPPVKKGP